MNAGRDVERLIADWLIEEAVPRAPDRVLNGARRRLDQTTQRRVAPPSWRPTTMNRYVPLAGAAAIVLVVVGGSLLLRRPASVLVGAPSTVPSVSATPTSAVSSASASVAALILPNGVTCGHPLVPAGAAAAGCIEVPQTWLVDLEHSKLATDDTAADIWFEAITEARFAISSVDQVQLRLVTEPDRATCVSALAQPASPPVENVAGKPKRGPANQSVSFSDIPADAQLCIESRDDELFNVRLLGFDRERTINGLHYSVIVLDWVRWSR